MHLHVVLKSFACVHVAITKTKQIIDILFTFLTEYSHQCQWLSECDDGWPRSAVSVMASYPQQDATGRKWSVPLPCYCISTTFIYQFFSHKSVPVHCISSAPIYQCRFYVFVSLSCIGTTPKMFYFKIQHMWLLLVTEIEL